MWERDEGRRGEQKRLQREGKSENKRLSDREYIHYCEQP